MPIMRHRSKIIVATVIGIGIAAAVFAHVKEKHRVKKWTIKKCVQKSQEHCVGKFFDESSQDYPEPFCYGNGSLTADEAVPYLFLTDAPEKEKKNRPFAVCTNHVKDTKHLVVVSQDGFTQAVRFEDGHILEALLLTEEELASFKSSIQKHMQAYPHKSYE